MPTRWLTDLPSLASLPDDYLLTGIEVASYLRIDEKTVESWRRETRSTGPTYVRLGDGKRSPVRYPAGLLRAWIAANTHGPVTGGQTPARTA